MKNVYRGMRYEAQKIGFGKRPGIIVVDFQTAFTDP